MVLRPVGSTSLEPTLKRDRVDDLIDSPDSVRCSILYLYTELLRTDTPYGAYGDMVQNMKIEHSIVSSGTKNPLSRGDEEKNVLNSILHDHSAVSNQSETSIDTASRQTLGPARGPACVASTG
ncbi:hypothetical protein N7537_011680 [Penicillium hordei]|uniref:Uncharacterized protein n=1 Tax=Penicillium hordei TaxID=40994 RepID=A0AAD6DNJ8_9EURO|nr:uncharacterized protein N7537_011680 [Penicillium hordei]KAJ5589002.1 hypothetical protein N7537_011680 [Penicillium hordei]